MKIDKIILINYNVLGYKGIFYAKCKNKRMLFQDYFHFNNKYEIKGVKYENRKN